jgi:two-component system, chemotaxis family, CheB/CheR fusion protein
MAKQSEKTKSERRGSRERNLARPSNSKIFPIVGIGASAGGLEAFTQLLGQLPQRMGMALVFVQHLAPRHESALSELLGRATEIRVSEVKDGMIVEPDRVYVIPPNTNMAIQKGRLYLMPRGPAQPHLPIDFFMRSLAEELGSRAIGVILSGTASDGTLGLKAIKAEGGITFAQDEKSAKYSDMPRNAVAAQCVDFVLPPESIARELVRIAHHPYLLESRTMREESSPPQREEELRKIFAQLRAASGVDFTHYKHTTIKRRIKRRMVVHKLQELGEYVTYLQQNPSELDALYQDILIHVTGFFRDQPMFDALKAKVFPSLMKDRRPTAPLRIWVPGCSTGEEVYSIVMSLLEFLGDSAGGTEVQVFATDISEAALEKARTGIYMDSVVADVSPERLRRFFLKTAHGYQISKAIREMCVFARQDMVKDPPFSRIDLISCRNLLIYLGTVLQKKIIPVLHYALKPTGFLVLGTSETVGPFAEHFTVVDKKNKIYAKKPTGLRLPANYGTLSEYGAGPAVPRKGLEDTVSSFDIQKEADRILLTRFAPAGVIINEDLDIIQFRGHTGSYLEATPGQASLSLPKMTREGLLVDVRGAIQKARKDDAPVKKHGVQIRSDEGVRELSLEVIPIRGPSPAERYFLVLFEKPAISATAGPGKSAKGAKERGLRDQKNDRQLTLLRNELAQTKSTLQSIIEEQDTTNEELKSANEEILSSNEELQSTNEELETAKEELQSTNEELTTLNEELQNRNTELSVANNDLINLLASVNIPMLMLGNDLRIRRFTPQAEKLLNLIPTDVGRPISDIKPNFSTPKMEELIVEAIDSVSIKERELQDLQGRWYSMRIRPYRTAENKLDGAVITWIDITALKVSLEHSRAYAEAIVDNARESLLVLDGQLRVQTANQTFYRTFRVSTRETEDLPLYELGEGQWNIPRLRHMLDEILPKNNTVNNFEVDQEFPQIGRRSMMVNARRIEMGGRALILLAIEDWTALKQAGESLRELSDRAFNVQSAERQRLARELHDTTAASLADLTINLSVIRKAADGLEPDARRMLEDSLAIAGQCTREIRTLSYLLHPPLVHELGLAAALRMYVQGFIERSGVEVKMDFPPDSEHLSQRVELAALRIVQESLSNIHRHSGSATARVQIARGDGNMTVEVSDDGHGLPAGVMDTSVKTGPKAGVGLRGIEERVRELGGHLEIHSGNKGTTVRATLPIGGALA